jgi:hypothetical protein
MERNQCKPIEMYDIVYNTAIMLGPSHLKAFLNEFGTREEYARKVEAL